MTAIPGLGIRAASRPRPLAGSPPDGGPGLERTVNEPLATVLTTILTKRLSEVTQGRIARGRPFTCAHVGMDVAIWSPTLRDGLLLCIDCYCQDAEQAFGGPEEHCGICGALYRSTAGETLTFMIHPQVLQQGRHVVNRPPIVVFAGICPACLAKYRTQGVRHGDAR